MPKPLVIARCQIEVDPEGKSLPVAQCWRDRERTVNPELLKGLVCETETDVFEKDGKRVHRWEVVCRPPMKLYRKLRHSLSPNVVQELRDLMNRHKPPPKSTPPTRP